MTTPIRTETSPVTDLLGATLGSADHIAVAKPGGFQRRTARSVRLKMPPLNQFRLHDTQWATRYGVRARALVAKYGGGAAGAGLKRHLAALTAAVENAPLERTKAAVRPIRAAHQQLRRALQGAGATPQELGALDRERARYETWWKRSGPKACAQAAERGMKLLSGKPTGLGRITAGARRRLFSRTRLHAGYLQRRQARPDKLYKGRYLTYDVGYSKARLQQVAQRMIGKLRAGQPVHTRVLTGVLHRDTGSHPKATHSLLVDGYTRVAGTDQRPQVVDFHFTDPDGGGSGVLRLDVQRGRFEHVPATMSWNHMGANGWDYDAARPPYRYQVLSVR